jgi:RNA polymerase sigma-70 factor (ECF subfamily)
MSAIGENVVEPVGGAVLAPSIAELYSQLYSKSKAADFGLGAEEFAAILDEVAAKGAPAASPKQKQDFCSRLFVEDLVLTRMCAAGNERAWEVFMLRFREKLYDVARQITREDSAGRELADSVYADLYGTRTRDDERVCKLNSYSGRGSLDGWLRTVLAQEYVNRYRRQRRLVSLDEESEEGTQYAATTVAPAIPLDTRLERATDDALRSLSAEDRFVLASYFLDQRTLAQIARTLSVHESTISRKVEKLTKGIRKQILKNLIQQGMGRRQAEEALSADVRDVTVDIRASLAQDSVAPAFSEKGAKAGEGGS